MQVILYSAEILELADRERMSQNGNKVGSDRGLEFL